MDKISIITPVYNTKNYIKHSVDSILQQTHNEIEIILIDDGSTDTSGKMLDEYALHDSHVISIHKTNSGPAASRNNGLKLSSGNFVGFVDSDDWIEPRMYSILLEQIKNLECDVAVCGYDVYKDNRFVREVVDSCVGQMSRQDYAEYLLRTTDTIDGGNNRVWRDNIWSKLFRKEVIGEKLFDEEFPVGEDCVFLFDTLENINKVCYANKSLYHYNSRTTSLSKEIDCSLRVKSIPAHEKVVSLSKNVGKGPFNIAEARYLDICLQYYENCIARKALRGYLGKHFPSFILNSVIPNKLKIVYCYRAIVVRKK